MVVLFLCLALVFLILAIHPFITFPLTLGFLRKLGRKPIQADPNYSGDTYAICVCAYNEEAVIEKKAENLLELKRAIPGLEVFVYVDAASDRTAQILEKYKNDFDITVAEERHGKTYGMNLLVAKASASIVIFSDANVMLDVSSIPSLSRYFADPNVGCVCGHLIYINDEITETSENGSLYWKLEEKIKQLETDTGSVMGADGSIFAIRRHLHTSPPADLIDDMFVSLSILCKGYRLVRAVDVIAYEKSVTVAKEEFRRKVRIACQAFNVHRVLWPQLRELPALNLYKYLSHKLLRWFTIYWLVGAALCLLVSMLLLKAYALTGITIVIACLATWIGANYRVPILTQLVDIAVAFLGAGLGVFKSIRGERYQTWTPAASIRNEGNNGV